MYETILCKCGTEYTNVGAIPQLCPKCWEKSKAEFDKKYPNKKIHVFDY